MRAVPLMSLLLAAGIGINSGSAITDNLLSDHSAVYGSSPKKNVADAQLPNQLGEDFLSAAMTVRQPIKIAAETDRNTPPEKPKLANDPPPKIGPVIGKRGPVEVTLWWNTTDDLDLFVVCPPAGLLDPWELTPVRAKRIVSGPFRGRIMGMGPGVCGDGSIDVDANRQRLHPVNNPAEHAVWQNSIPAGVYTVGVRPSKLQRPNYRVSYSLRVELNGEQKICNGEVGWNDRSSRIAGFQQLVIKFAPGQSLPDCHLENQPTFWGPPKP